MGSRRIRRLLEYLEGGPEAIDSIADRSSVVGAEEVRVGWSVLAGWIVQAHREMGFLSVVVYGRQGAGKSVYAIKVAFDALRRLGVLRPHHTTREVFKRYMVFTVRQFISALKHVEPGDPLPLLIWDDAGVYAGSYLFFTDPLSAKAIADIFRVARTRVSSIIFTTPSPRDILKPLRSYDTVLVYVRRVDSVWSEAHIYTMRLLPSGDARIRKAAVERFKRKLRTYPDYLKIRDSYATDAIEKLEQLLTVKELERKMREIKLLGKAAKARARQAESEESLDDIEVIVTYRDD